jgi:sulfoxide reductase heme-binding subunit YedZ
MPKFNRWWVLKPVVLLGCFTPLVWITYAALTNQLSANPIKDITEFTGIWTLRFLMITLAITPLRRITGWNSLIRFRRMIGLFTFFHAFLHLMTYVWLDQFFMWSEIAKDIVKRPFITSGMAGFTLMIPLAVTSTKKWIGRLGGKRWQILHRLIYLSGFAGVLHYYFFVKSDIQYPVAYALLLTILLGFRGWMKFKDTRPQGQPDRLKSVPAAER